MGKNLIGGKKSKRCKNTNSKELTAQKMLVLKEEEQDYAIVTKMLGDGRLLANTIEKKDILCIIRGKMRKRVWINTNDIILISYRDYQDNKADVILKYNDEEKSKLKKLGELKGLTDYKKDTSLDEIIENNDVYDFDFNEI